MEANHHPIESESWTRALTGSNLLRFVQRVLPFIVLLMVGLVLFSRQFGSAGVEAVGDRYQYDLAVAESLSDNMTFGLPGGAKAAPGSHILWQVLLGIVGKVISDVVKAAFLLNFLLAACVVWQVVRLAERVLLHPVFVTSVGVVTAASLPVQAGMVSTGPNLLAFALILMAIRLHMSGIAQTRPVLNVSSALFVGLAMLVHVEFFLVWIAFVLHALLASYSKESKFNGGNVLFQGLAGTALCAILLWPVVHLSAKSVSSFWVIQNEGSQPVNAGTGIGRVVGDMLSSGGVTTVVVWALAIVGVIALFRQFEVRRQSRALLVGAFLFLLVPLGYGALTGATGTMASHCLTSSMFPLAIVTALFATFWLGSLASRKLAVTFTLIAATAFTGLSLIHVLDHGGKQAQLRQQQAASRSFWSGWIDSNTTRGRLNVATDRPGCLALHGGANVTVDLNGWASPSLATCRTTSSEAALDPLKFHAWLSKDLKKELRPSVLVLWEEESLQLASSLEKVKRGFLRDISPASNDQSSTKPQILQVRY